MSKMICGNCGTLGEPAKLRKGSLALGILVSPLFLAGVKWYMGCPACGAPNMVSVDSPRGQELLPAAKANAERLAARKPTENEVYYSEGWWVTRAGAPPIGPFKSKEEALFGEVPTPAPTAPAAPRPEESSVAESETRAFFKFSKIDRAGPELTEAESAPSAPATPAAPRFSDRASYLAWKAGRS